MAGRPRPVAILKSLQVCCRLILNGSVRAPMSETISTLVLYCSVVAMASREKVCPAGWDSGALRSSSQPRFPPSAVAMLIRYFLGFLPLGTGGLWIAAGGIQGIDWKHLPPSRRTAHR
jgi:hypothetical protein